MATDEPTTEALSDEDVTIVDKPSSVDLPHGDALTLADTCEITRANETSLVVVAGSPACGKTTLLASLMHCLQRGPVAGFLYAGSATCIGFDRRCHLGRTTSRAAQPDTERTKYKDRRRLLHLRLRHKSLTTPARDVLFTDISGEEYEEIRHSVDVCREFDLFTRADSIVVLIDGERLADAGGRHAARIEVTQLLQCMLDAGHLHDESRLDVLIAKYDLMNGEAAEKFAALTEREILEKFGNKVAVCRQQRIAARPARLTTEYTLGHGLEALLPDWIGRRVPQVDLSKRCAPAAPLSEFDKYLERHSPGFVMEPTT